MKTSKMPFNDRHQMRVLHHAGLLASMLVAAGPLLAQPEQVVFSNVPSNGVLNSPVNAVRQHTFTGGYTLGRIDLFGTLASVHQRTWARDSQILITAPGGQTAVFQPFPTGGQFTTLPFNRSLFMPPGTDPTGEWTFRFFELFDDGGPSQIDAMWQITIRLTDEPPAPPGSVDLGELEQPGTSLSIPILGGTSGDVRWYRFTIATPVAAAAGTYLDIDTIGSALTGDPPDDTIIALYNASGELIASDDDSGTGFTSQLTFGAGTRPALGEGQPYNGRHGSLSAGDYYLALATHPATIGPVHWTVSSTAVRTGTMELNISTNLGAAPLCYANCDLSTNPPILNVDDFICFINAFAEGLSLPPEEQIPHYANCDHSTLIPVLSVDDFTCFINAFATGCP